jgi:hypothetical protein
VIDDRKLSVRNWIILNIADRAGIGWQVKIYPYRSYFSDLRAAAITGNSRI